MKNPIYIGKTRHKGKFYDGQHAAIVDSTVWHEVQALITRNKHQSDTRTLAKDPSLLAGLIYDDKGNPMSPTHTRKHNRRYRYYISQAALQFKEKETGSVVRLAAQIVESLVINTLLKLLTVPKKLLDAIQQATHSTSDIKRLIGNTSSLAAAWDNKSPSDHIALFKAVIYRIIVGKHEVKIVFSRTGIREVIQPGYDYKTINKPETPEDEFEVVKSVSLKRSGIESKLIISEEPTTPAHPETVRAIQNAVSKALVWNDALINGAVSSMTELAEQEKVVPQFIVRRMKLAYLAPDVIETIFNGHIPHTLSLGMLEKSIPLNWEDQRQLFGFTA